MMTRRDTFRSLAVLATPAAAAQSVRLGVIGCGNRGRELLRTIRAGKLPGECKALCDIVPEHAITGRVLDPAGHENLRVVSTEIGDSAN